MGYAFDVQPPRCHVSGDQDRQCPVFEVLQDTQPFALINIPGNNPAGETVGIQSVMKVFPLALGVDEDHGALHSLAPQKAEQKRKLLFAGTVVEQLFHPFGSHLLRGNRDFFRQVHEFIGKLHHPLVEGGREHQVLPSVEGRQAAQNEAQVGDEAHVEHSVGLVDNQHFDPFQGIHLLFQIVDQAPRRTDNQVGTVTQGIFLFHVIDTAVDCLDNESA